MLRSQRFTGLRVTPHGLSSQHSRRTSHINSRSIGRRIGSIIARSALLASGLVAVTTTPAQAVTNFTNKTTANGLGNNNEPLGLFCRLHTVDISGWDVRFVA